VATEALIAQIGVLAREQHGLIRVDQVPAADQRRFRDLAKRGIFERVAKGVYRANGSPASWMQTVQAGVWALGPLAVVSHGAAARLYVFDRFVDSPAEFTVPRGQRGRQLPAGLAASVHTTTSLPKADIRRVDGLPVTSPERTIVDLARAGTPSKLLEAAIDSSIRLRLTTLDHIVGRIAECRGTSRWGIAQLDTLVLTSGGHSVLERQFLRLINGSGLPMPKPQVVHRRDGRHVARVDFLFEDEGVVVEVSGGRGHSSAAERSKDARRRNHLQQMGRAVLEFTYEDVNERGTYVLSTLKTAGVSRS
jgi:Protein of unknown function (DUF559)